MTHIVDELEGYDVYFRDRLQFELKSDFLPDPSQKENRYTQEFYIFIPQALQVNKESYTRAQFYRDETNLIRFKTPVFTLGEIADLEFTLSPLAHIWNLRDEAQSPKNESTLIKELKLLANVIRSSVRTRTQFLNHLLDDHKNEKVEEELKRFIDELQTLNQNFLKVKRNILDKWSSEEVAGNFKYVGEFLKQIYDQYLLQLLSHIQELGLSDPDKRLKEFIFSLSKTENSEKVAAHKGENLIYKKSLLNKYVLDALRLNINRFQPSEKYSGLIGSIAAGFAMLIYVIFFIIFGHVWVINSEPFLLATVVVYILKDRIKDGLKNITSHERLGWFSDYTTEIRSPDEKHVLGVLKEKFDFIRHKEVPADIRMIRDREFHSVMESFNRPETVIYYKKNITIFEKPEGI
ncbi:MAG: hypothetical protein KDK48_04210, partial [Chlamydiia bacterium]|nr:hypothetical protein [Chlamydiia bacterium]